MAQLAVAGAGAAVGFVLGGPVGAQIGWALGGVAGALLFPPKGQDTQGPRLNDLTVQTSGYGLPIPMAVGRVKLAGNVIWKTELRERANTRRQGKGGGGAKSTTYSYYLSWAVGLCEWLIPPANPQVLRIWLDAQLVYDTTGASEVTQIPGLVWRFHPGNETQLPDPLLAATLGANEAPAHRGLAYIVFEEVPLERFGNRMPNVTVELAGDAARSFPQVGTIPPAAPLWPSSPSGRTYLGSWACNVAVDYRRGRIYEGRVRTSTSGGGANEMIRVYDLVTMQTLGEHTLDRILGPLFPFGTSPGPDSTGTGLMHLGVDGFLYITGGNANRVPLFKIDPDAMRGVGVFGNPLGDGFGFGDNGTRLVNPMAITSLSVPRLGARPRTFVIVQGSYSSTLTIDADRMEYVWGAGDVAIEPPPVPIGLGIGPLTFPVILVPGRTRDDGGVELWYLRASELATPFRIDVARFRYYSGAASLGGGAAMGIFRDDYASIDVQAEIDPLAVRPLLQAAFWDASDDTLVITLSGTGGPLSGWGRFSTIKWSPGAGVVWKVVDHVLPAFHDGRGQITRVLGATWGLGGNFLIQTGSGDVLVNQAGADFNTLFWLDEQQAVLGQVGGGAGVREIAKRYLSRAAANSLTVGQVVAALCQRAGLAAGDINAAALNDPLRGYILPRPTSARDAITPLAGAFQFDAVEQDDVLLFRQRAGAVVATIPYDDMIREDPDASVLQEQRAQDADLPRELTVRFLDVERGFEQNAQSWRRPVSPTATVGANASVGIDLPIPMTAGEAKAVARRLITGSWRERTRLSCAVGPRHARLVPTDPVTLTTRDGAAIRARILSTQLGANWVTRIEAVTEDAASYALTAPAEGGAGWAAPTMPVPYFARLILPDLALVDDADDLGQAGLREYALVAAYDGQRFRGVVVHRSPDQASWDALGAVTTPVTWGSVSLAPAMPASPWTWDDTGVLEVQLADGEVDSATELEVLNGANRAALIDSDGRAEIIQFRDAEDVGGGRYRLTGLLRGRRGTEDLIASRAAGDTFVLLDATRFLFQAQASEAASTRHHRAVTVFETVETAASTVTKTSRGRAERPYAPCAITGTRDGSQNLTIAWIRRTRVGGEWLDGTGTVPVSESSEAYEVDMLNGPPAVTKTYFSSHGTPANAFDGSTTTEWLASSDPHFVGVIFETDQTVRQYEIVARPSFASSDSPKDWTFQGRGTEVPTFFGDGGTPANLFDEGTAEWGVASTTLPRHAGISFPVAQTVAQYAVRAPGSYVGTDAPKDWTLEGSNDLATWVVLDTRSSITGWAANELKAYTLASPVSYRHYRLRVTAGQASGGGINMRVQELELYATVGGLNITSGWVVLDTRSAQTGWSNGQVRGYALSAAATYRSFRIRVTAGNGGGNRGFAELRLRRGTGTGAGNIAASTYAPATVRTIAVTTATAAYSAASQTTDFGATQSEVFVRVHQMSGLVGRGLPAEATL